MAGKLLLLLGLGAAALALSSGTAHADQGGGGGLPHPAGGFDVNAPPPDILALIAQAVSSGDPKLMRSTAQHLADLGYNPQADALRKMADAIDAAQKAIPTLPGGGPVPIPAPGGGTIVLPPMVIPGAPPSQGSGANPLAAQLTSQLLLTDPIVNGRTPENSQHDLVVKFQAQEKAAGKYTGPLDGLYGAGTALGVASYNIVPYPPFIWSIDKKKTAANKANFKKQMLAKAAADPTRADEWSHVASAAQNT